MIAPPLLPLVLWETPPALGQILGQEGISHVAVDPSQPLSIRAGRFVLCDGARITATRAARVLRPDQTLIDIDTLRAGEPFDPFDALLDTGGAHCSWNLGGVELHERIHRFRRAELRHRLLSRLSDRVIAAGGLWARLSPFPYPYRSAFGFRVDLDEPVFEDYHRFARAREPLNDCTTHFVSTSAYGRADAVMTELAGLDTQSHGHHHHIYRDPNLNRKNLLQAERILRRTGINPTAFASPGGRWNAPLDRLLEDLGYVYSSEFQVGYDDLPFHCWRGDRFSKVLQVPIHPICEGLFLEAGVRDPSVIADHLVRVLAQKVDAHEPAFLYGHPERRLGRYPEIVRALADAVRQHDCLWRVTLTEFAAWWHWRGSRVWSAVSRDDQTIEILFEDWDDRHPLGIEILRGAHGAQLPITGPRSCLRLDHVVWERRPLPSTLPEARVAREPWNLRTAVKQAIDWELVTPLDELSSHSIRGRIKSGLRYWRDRVGGDNHPTPREGAA